MSRSKRVTLDGLVAEASVDCYGDSECITGFYTMLEEHLAVPFQTTVLGTAVTVTGVDLTDDDQIVAVCAGSGVTQRAPVLDLQLPAPAPAGAEWVGAYRLWVQGG
ncbi:MAG: hypothetical protein ACRDQ7_18420 [Haloechinothrix sp.]